MLSSSWLFVGGLSITSRGGILGQRMSPSKTNGAHIKLIVEQTPFLSYVTMLLKSCMCLKVTSHVFVENTNENNEIRTQFSWLKNAEEKHAK